MPYFDNLIPIPRPPGSVAYYMDTYLTSIGMRSRVAIIDVFAPGDAVASGDGKYELPIVSELNGMNLFQVAAFVKTASTSGLPTVQIRNVTDGVDILTTPCTIDENETSSLTADTAAAIDTTKDDIATGDIIAIDVDIEGTGTKGLKVVLTFKVP